MSTRTGTTPRAVPRWLAALTSFALALVGVTGVVVAVAPPASATTAGVQVYVGYADTIRSNPVNFPTPWSGTPGVIFAGCTASCSFDAGAVRIVNNSTTVQTIDAITVSLSTCTFDMWPKNTVLQPGQQFIITQTASGASGGCDNANGYFDTSDIGPNGVNWSSCNQSGVIPQINATIDGVVNTFVDSKQVLNTGGIDVGGCPPGSNESQQWSLVGTRCTGATLALAPPTQTEDVYATADVTATLANSCGDPLQGATVDFTVPSGPNAGQTGSATTDANGNATFAYSSSLTGTDTVTAAASNPAGQIVPPGPVSVVWQQRTPVLTITGGAGTSDYNDAATVDATLTADGSPIAGAPVDFGLNGSETCTGTTNAGGVAACSITPGEAAGSYPLTATFAGDAADLPASASSGFTVTREETTLTYTGPTKAANGGALTLSGVLKEDGTAPISGRTVGFTLGSGSSAQSCTGTTDASGAASCTIASVNQPASTTSVAISADFAGDTYYLPADAAATASFEYLTGRAYGLSSSGLVSISPVPDTGNVKTASAGQTGTPCVVSLSGLISAGTLCAGVKTSVDPGQSTATASVQSVTVGVLGLPVIKIGAVQSVSETTCSGSSGSANIASVTVGGIPVNVNVHPGANTTVSVLGVTLIFNEQVPLTGPDAGLTVNAVHIKALGLLDVVVASSTSDIGNC